MNTRDFILQSLSEDFGDGDHTSLSCIPAGSKGEASLLVKANGILAGVELAREIFHQTDPDLVFHHSMNDGERVEKGNTAFSVSGSIHTILGCERLVLNCMQRMSGIATLTHAYVEKAAPYGTIILDTRKTSPLFRKMEKAAVKIGGGQNHRMGLYDMILIKDNHVDFAGSIKNAITRSLEYKRLQGLQIPIEVETRNLKEVEEALATGGINRIMFDNFNPETMYEAVKMVNKQFETEASGGIHLDNVTDYAATGVDFISVGALTHSAVSLDLSLKAKKY